MPARFSAKLKPHKMAGHDFISIQENNPTHWPRKLLLSHTPMHTHIQ